MAELLHVEDLRIRLPGPGGPVTVVDGVGFGVGTGEILGVAGESGSGKTMCALALLGLQPPEAVVTGKVSFQGRNLLALESRERRAVRGKEIAIVFQDPMTSLHPMLTIGRQLTEHMRRHLGIGKDEAMRRAEALLGEVRIPDPERAVRSHPHQFSGGMRQRIVVAMALACEPKLLIADEPTTALDVTVQAGILHLLADLCRARHMAMLLITHDLGVMSSVAHSLAIFYAGRIVENGPTREVLQRPHHPYTERLLLALPDPQNPGPLTTIPGTPATPLDRPPGCAFHPRCPYAEPSCAAVVPALEPVGVDRWSACPVAPLWNSGGAARATPEHAGGHAREDVVPQLDRSS